MPRADSASVLIPPGSPLAVGWRADVVALLMRHGLIQLLDVISAYAELCMRAEPDTAHDPLDARTSLLTPGPQIGRPRTGTERVPATVSRLADPACRRIDHKAELLRAEKRALPRLPHPSRIPGRKDLARRRRVQQNFSGTD